MIKTKLKIHFWPDKILRKKCKPVKHFDENIRGILNDMCALMRVYNGVGLAANQAGIDLQLIVVEDKNKLFKLVNPRILKREGKIDFEEGCLSFPGVEIGIKRAKKIWLSAYDENGEKIGLEAEGIISVVLQHEIDHINGITFIDRLPLLQKLKIMPQLNALKKKHMIL